MQDRLDHVADTLPTTRLPSTPSTQDRSETELRAAHEFHGLRIGRYSVLRKLGEGGMGEVFVAFDEHLDRRVAIKLVHDTAAEDEQARRRFLREAQALARLAHPNVVSIYEAGVFGGRVYLAMEFVPGIALDEWQNAPGRTHAEIVACYVQAARGLEAAHAAGIVHRDFKPANVLMGHDGRARILDFGIAFAGEDAPAERTAAAPVATADGKLTQAGDLVGTPGYMSPEQILSEPVDARSDQWSFCVALFEALYRRPPFGTDLAQQFSRVLEGRVEAIAEDQIESPRLHAAILRGLSRDRNERFSSMTELLSVLGEDLDTDPAAQGRARLVFGIVLAFVVGAWTLRRFVSPLTTAPPATSLIRSAIVVLSVFVIAGIYFRRTLLPNRFHRAMMAGLGVILILVFLNRLLGVVHGQPGEVVLARDIFILGAGTMMLAVFAPLRRRLAWIPAVISLIAVGITFVAKSPLHVLDASHLAVNGAMIGYLYAWADASRRVQKNRLQPLRSGYVSPTITHITNDLRQVGKTRP